MHRIQRIRQAHGAAYATIVQSLKEQRTRTKGTSFSMRFLTLLANSACRFLHRLSTHSSSTTIMYIPPKRIKQEYAISTSCLRKWALEGKVGYTQLPGGKRLYSQSDIAALLGDNSTRRHEPKQEKAKVVYARVSSAHQKEDLERQIQDLRQAYPDHQVLSDIGSGLNFHRRGLQTLLELVFKRAVDEVVVAHRDRLCRFAFDLLETVFKSHGVRLVVHEQEDGGGGACRDELAQDLLSVVNFFVARHNGQRAGENRRKRKSREQDLQAARAPEAGPAATPVVRSL